MALTDQQIVMLRELANKPIGSDPADPHGWRSIEAERILNENGVQKTDTPAATPETPAAAAPAAATPDPAIDARNRQTFDTIMSILSAAGLTELYSVDAAGNPGGWVWDQITSNKGEAAILLEMETTAPFQQRYGIITQLREQAKTNPNVRVPSPGEVIKYREAVGRSMRAAGLPAWFYDENKDFDTLMMQGISDVEVEERLGRAWERVRDAPPAVRAAFNQFYGLAEGDAAMAAFFLDPNVTQAKLETVTRAAATAGRGSTLGLTIGREVAERVAQTNLSDAQIEQGLSEAAALSGLATESFAESGSDISQADTVAGTLLGDAQASGRLQRRLRERQALDQSTGGAAVNQSGVVGLG